MDGRLTPITQHYVLRHANFSNWERGSVWGTRGAGEWGGGGVFHSPVD